LEADGGGAGLRASVRGRIRDLVCAAFGRAWGIGPQKVKVVLIRPPFYRDIVR
jgi:hypothetical protein